MTPTEAAHWREFLTLTRAADVARAAGQVPDVVIVGEDNPHSLRRDMALADLPAHTAGGRLRTIVLGCSREVYLGPRVLRADLCEHPWSMPAAREEAARLARAYPSAAFVLLGARVRAAFRIPPADDIDGGVSVIRGRHHEAGAIHPRVVVCLPHPSSRNRVWRAPETVPRCRVALHDAGLGWLAGGAP